MSDDIKIKKSHEGRLTARAEAAGYGDSLEYAKHVLAHKDVYRPETVRQAQFAVNASKWKRK
jgi:hypothetical protein